jgi:hypothetical protein
MKCHPVCPFSIARVCVDDEIMGSALYSGGELVGATHGLLPTPTPSPVLIANGPQYKFNAVRVQPEDGDTCGLYCVHFVKYRYRNFTLEDIVNEFSARDPKTIEADLKDIYE